MARVRSRFRPPAPAAPAVGVGEGPDSGLRRSGLTCEEGEGESAKSAALEFRPLFGRQHASRRPKLEWLPHRGTGYTRWRPSFADVGRQLRLERGVAVVGEGEE